VTSSVQPAEPAGSLELNQHSSLMYLIEVKSQLFNGHSPDTFPPVVTRRFLGRGTPCTLVLF